VFTTLQDRLQTAFKGLRSRGRLTDDDIDATAREIRIALLEADVALPVVREFVSAIRERAKSEEVSSALNPAQQVIKIVNEELIEILGGDTRTIRFGKPPTVILLAGLQGAGKTTLAGKLAHWLRGQGHSPMLVACDLQRPNAVDQLKVMGERAGVPVFAPEPGGGIGDPVQVARDSVREAERRLQDVLIIDTAGRLGVDDVMMRQAIDIRDATDPDEILFVVDAMIGQDAVRTAEAFRDGVGFDGVVLSKLDGDARGGAALSIRHVTGRPVMFASTGEKITDFDVFHPDRMAGRILDMGDVLTLIESAEQAFDQDEAEKVAAKLQTERGLTLEDFLSQLQAVKKMGSLSKLLGMMPGMSGMRDQINDIDDNEIVRIEAIIRSMTPSERDDPRIINGSRRSRIAAGSGTTVTAVNQLVERFLEARKMMSGLARGQGIPGMPGIGGGPGGGAGKKPKQGKKKSSRGSGNPAKRAAEAASARDRARARAESSAGGDAAVDPLAALGANGDDFELPDDMKSLLGKSGLPGMPGLPKGPGTSKRGR
jgi:signal recognition particle subunit SRP54